MNRALILAAVLLAAGGAAAYFVLRPHGAAHPGHHSQLHGSDVHVEGVDRASAAMDAMFTAPEGKDPCDTLWIAIQAEHDTAAAQGKESRFIFVATHDDFFTRCEALPKDVQPCLTPRYGARHHDECSKLRPADELLAALFKAKPPEDALDRLEKLEKFKRNQAQLKLEQDQAKLPDPGQSAPPPPAPTP